MGVTLPMLALLSAAAAVVADGGRAARAADPQVPGVFVPRPVHIYGPDGGHHVAPHKEVLYSYRTNPFETEVYQRGQAPVRYQENQNRDSGFPNQQPQFFHAPGQQPLVYHPNFIPQSQYQPLANNYLRQFYNPSNPIANPAQQTFPEAQNQRFFAGHRSAPEVNSAPDHYGHHQDLGIFESFFKNSEQDSGFDRGHVESHPLETQVETFSNFRQAAYPDDSDSSPFSRAAVESVPVSAQVYTGLQAENSSPSGAYRNVEEGIGSFSRGDVESYPAVMLPYTADRDAYEERVRTEGDGYGSYGQAGFRQAVESPPIFTPLTDPAEAFPMPVHSNSRPWGHLSEKVLYDDPRAIGHAIPTPDVYSFYNPRMDAMRINEGYKVVCYYESWAIYRPQPLDFTVGDIDPLACTHLIYAFAGLDETNYTIMALDNDYDIVTGGYKALVALKAQNPQLKVMIGLGGWNEGGRKYSRMVSSPETRQKFVKSVIKFLDEHHFDGLDFDWEYPGASDRGGRYTDKENFAKLIKEMSAEFKMRGWVLSAAVSPARFRVNEGYDVPSLGQHLDFISVITYDLRGPWDGMADHHAPIKTRQTDSWAYKSLNALDGLRYWAEKGAPKHKLVLGVPFYARTFTLSDPTSYDPGARATSGGIEGRYTMDRGLYAYYEVCQEQRNGGWLQLRDEVGGPYMVKKDQWIGYDDVEYINLKMDMVRNEGFGGAMVWAIDLDDYLGMCGTRWPLLTAVRRRLADGSPPIDNITFPPEPQPGTDSESKPEPEAKPEPDSPAPDSEETQSDSDSQSTSSTSTPPKTDSSEELGSDGAGRRALERFDQPAPPGKGFVCPGPGIHRQSNECSSYYVCNRRFEVTKFVCPIGLQFDLSRKICNHPRYVSCGAGYAPASRRDCAGDGLYNNPSDCTMYAWCRGGVATHFTCPLGMRFDYLRGVCTEPAEASCNNHEMVRANFDNTTVNFRRPTFRQTRGSHKVVCFFPNWALNRPAQGVFVPENIDPSLCSHIVYAFATIDAKTLLLYPYDMDVDITRKFYERVIALKQRQPSVKVMISVGGWADSASDKYSRLVNDPRARKDFVEFSVRMLTAFGFDGLDLHWLYPTCPQMRCSGGNLADKQGFSALVSELRSAFNRVSPPLVLSATVAAARGIISRAYDARALNANVDFLNILTFDFHTHREGKTGHVSPLYQRPDDAYESQNSAFALEFWVRQGVSRSKINLGIPFYGQTFQLANPGQSSLYAPVIGPGDAGPITLQRGMLSYMEMCQRVRDRGWQIARDPSGAIGPFAHRGDQWVSYDDPISVSFKANYVKSEGFGGVMAWSIDFDDFSNKCCREPMPLLRTLARELLDLPLPQPRPGGDCTAPPPPVTPSPPVTTTTYSSGKLTRPTPIDWLPGDDGGKPVTHPTTRPPTRPPTTTRSTTTSTTTPRTSTWWWTPPPQVTTRKTTERTTTTTTTTTTPKTSTWWWTPPPSTTRRTTTVTTTTTRRPTRRPTTTRRPRPTTPPSRPPSGAGPVEGDECNSGEFYPVSGECNRFLRCMQGRLKSFKCAPRLHWNQKNKLCDWPSTAGCSSESESTADEPATTTSRPRPPWFTTTPRSTIQTLETTRQPIRTTTWWWKPPVTSTSRPFTTTTRRPVTTTARKPVTTTTRRPMISQEPDSSPCEPGTKIPHPTDCGLFLDCTSAREWTSRRCAPGLEWDRKEQLCNWPQLAGCTRATRETDAPIPASPSTTSAPSPTTTSRAEATQASLTTVSSSCTTEGSYMHDPTDCSSYYLCVHGEYRRFTCQKPLQWNKPKKICDWPKNIDCKETGSGAGSSKPPRPAAGDKPTVIEPSTTPRPPPVELEPVGGAGQLSGDFMVVCYFTNWAWYRPGIGKYTPDDIDPSICTHIVYGFAVLDYSNLIIKPHDSWADLDNNFYRKVTALKKRGIKVTVAIGGWNDSAGDKYSRLVNNPSARRKFTEHVIEFITKYDFDGLDLDWEYPKCWQVDCKKGPDSDKQAFADWVRELSEAFKPRGLLLSAAVSPSKKVIDAGYDVPALNRYLDWIAVMTYDYHGQWDKKTGHVAPMYYHPEDDIDYFNMDFTIRYWLEQGATPNKIVLGMPMYGQSFTLNDPSVNGLNAPARTGGTAGEFTRAKGFLAYYEICDRVRNRGWTVVKDPEHRMGPYAYSGNQWVSYDDVDTIRRKSQYIRDKGLAGGMIWALDLDDFRNRCGQGAHPLMKTIQSVLGPPRGGPSLHEETGAPPPPPPPALPPPSVQPQPVAPAPPKPALPDTDTAVGSLRPSSTDDGGFKVVCYFTNWAWYRQGEGKYTPDDIDSSLCTHIVYGFAVLDNSKLLIKPHDTWADFDNKFYEKVTSHKSKGVKVLIAIGGWNDSRGSKYSKLVNNPSARRRFTEHVLEFILKHNFDGLDLDWEYPKCWQVDCKKGPASDKQAFSAWIMELHEAFKPHGLLLSAAVSPSNKVIDAGYEIPMLSRYLDWIAVMTYDYHGQWDKKTGHVAPMYVHPDTTNEFFNTNFTIHYWIQGGADRKKLVMGMPMYGQSFTLAQASDNTLNQKTYGGGEAGPHTRARGFLAYYEICYFIKNQGWVVVRDPLGTMGPYAYRGNQWVGFDDVDVIRYKSEYIKKMGLGGGMIWALDLDDFRDRCGCEKHPLLRTINRVLRDYPVPDPNCPTLGGGPPTQLRPFGSPPLALTPTTTTTTTLPPWMTTRKTTVWSPTTTPSTPLPPWKTTRKTTSWTPWSASTTQSTTPSSTPRITPPPWMTSSRRSSTKITRAPWLPPEQTTQPPRFPGSGSVADQKCEIGEYKRHESDCNKFYQCNQGKFEERKCFPGLHWAESRCEYPAKANCDLSGSAPPSESRPTTPPPSVDKPSTWQPPPQTTAVAIPTTKKPIYPPMESDPSGFKVVCYFTNWAWYRQGIGKYKPEDIDASLCTHIVYGFAVLDGTRLLIKPHDTWADYDNAFYKKVTDLKSKGVKVLIAIGGWNDSAGDKYSRLVNSPESRRKFNEHVIEFILKHNFDGLDLDWEYPKCWQVECKKGPDSDKPAFSAWIRELHDAFKPHGLLLSAAVSPSYKVIDAGYEVPALNRYLDWIAVMTYDYHGHWDKKTGHVAPMFHHPESLVPEFNANYTIHYWMAHGADRKKLVMGMPMYGQSFALASAKDNGLNAKSYGRGEAGEFTRAGGFLAYYEICDRILNRGYTVVRDPQGTIGPYAYKGGQWFGFDDISMIRYKSQYVKDMGLGGAMIWALDLDDFRNRCGCEEHPLLRTINRVLRDYPIPDPGCSL